MSPRGDFPACPSWTSEPHQGGASEPLCSFQAAALTHTLSRSARITKNTNLNSPILLIPVTCTEKKADKQGDIHERLLTGHNSSASSADTPVSAISVLLLPASVHRKLHSLAKTKDLSPSELQ